MTLYMFDMQRPMGLLSLLDEESKFPRSTDHSLAGKQVRSSGVSKTTWPDPYFTSATVSMVNRPL